jgi:hypothetical protein
MVGFLLERRSTLSFSLSLFNLIRGNFLPRILPALIAPSSCALQKKGKGVQNLIAVENPNAARKNTVKAKDIDLAASSGSELSRRER